MEGFQQEGKINSGKLIRVWDRLQVESKPTQFFVCKNTTGKNQWQSPPESGIGLVVAWLSVPSVKNYLGQSRRRGETKAG